MGMSECESNYSESSCLLYGGGMSICGALRLTVGSVFFVLLVVQSQGVLSQENLIGQWVDKTSPTEYRYHFSEGSNFQYTQNGVLNGKRYSTVLKGAWEVGEWSVTKANGVKRPCSLKIYASNSQCCFSHKQIANNLILTEIYSSDEYSNLCSNRVLIKESDLE